MVKQIYAIECQGGYIYVGESDNPDARYLEHKNGTEHASEFCKRHKPIRQLAVFNKTTPYDETNLTKDYMKKFGIDKVRGGPYTQLELDKSTKDVLEREFLSESNKCYNCGNSGHFIKQCPSKVQIKEEITLKKKSSRSRSSRWEYESEESEDEEDESEEECEESEDEEDESEEECDESEEECDESDEDEDGSEEGSDDDTSYGEESEEQSEDDDKYD